MKLKPGLLSILGALISTQVFAAEGVSRSAFTTAIDNREPVNEISQLSSEESKVYYFTEIKGLKDQIISHRWEQNGEVQATVDFTIGGDRWRVWSSKNLQPEFSGEWQVMVVDEAGNVLAQNSFNYGDTLDSIDTVVDGNTQTEKNMAIDVETQESESLAESTAEEMEPATE